MDRELLQNATSNDDDLAMKKVSVKRQIQEDWFDEDDEPQTTNDMFEKCSPIPSQFPQNAIGKQTHRTDTHLVKALPIQQLSSKSLPPNINISARTQLYAKTPVQNQANAGMARNIVLKLGPNFKIPAGKNVMVKPPMKHVHLSKDKVVAVYNEKCSVPHYEQQTNSEANGGAPNLIQQPLPVNKKIVLQKPIKSDRSHQLVAVSTNGDFVLNSASDNFSEKIDEQTHLSESKLIEKLVSTKAFVDYFDEHQTNEDENGCQLDEARKVADNITAGENVMVKEENLEMDGMLAVSTQECSTQHSKSENVQVQNETEPPSASDCNLNNVSMEQSDEEGPLTNEINQQQLTMLDENRVSIQSEIENYNATADIAAKCALLSKHTSLLSRSTTDGSTIKSVVQEVQTKSNSIVPPHTIKNGSNEYQSLGPQRKLPGKQMQMRGNYQANTIQQQQQRKTNNIVPARSIQSGPNNNLQRRQQNSVTPKLIGKHPRQSISSSRTGSPLPKQLKVSANPTVNNDQTIRKAEIPASIKKMMTLGNIVLTKKPPQQPQQGGNARQVADAQKAASISKLVALGTMATKVPSNTVKRNVQQRMPPPGPMARKQMLPPPTQPMHKNAGAQQSQRGGNVRLAVARNAASVQPARDVPPKMVNTVPMQDPKLQDSINKMGITIKRTNTREIVAEPAKRPKNNNFAGGQNASALAVAQQKMVSGRPGLSAGHQHMNQMATKQMAEEKNSAQFKQNGPNVSAGYQHLSANKYPDLQNLQKTPKNLERVVRELKFEPAAPEVKLEPVAPKVKLEPVGPKMPQHNMKPVANGAIHTENTQALAIMPAAASIIPKSQCRLTTNNYQSLLEIRDVNGILTNYEIFDCPICSTSVEIGNGIVLQNCLHWFCKGCVKNLIVSSLLEEIWCPFVDETTNSMCGDLIKDSEIRTLLNRQEYNKYLQQTLGLAENGEYIHCQAHDCRGWAVAIDTHTNTFVCSICKATNCIPCKAIHPMITCDEYQAELLGPIEEDTDIIEWLAENEEDGGMICPNCEVHICFVSVLQFLIKFLNEFNRALTCIRI